MKRVVIIGGGISGLAAAYFLQQKAESDTEIILLESSSRLGGVIESVRKDGFLLEMGPDSWTPQHPAAVRLFQELRFEEDAVSIPEKLDISYLYHQNKFKPIPRSIFSFLSGDLTSLIQSPLLSGAGKMRMFLEPLMRAPKGDSDESIGQFMRRRFGAEALNEIFQPVLSGIFGSDLNTLSFKALMPHLAAIEKQHGSIGKYYLLNRKKQKSKPSTPAFVSFKNGMSDLIRKIAESLNKVEIECDAEVAAIHPGREWSLKLSDGRMLQAEAVCIAVPAFNAVSMSAQSMPPVSKIFSRFPSRNLVHTHHAVDAAKLASFRGTGFVTCDDRRLIASGTFSHLKYPGRSNQRGLIRAYLKDHLETGFGREETFELAALLSLDPASLERLHAPVSKKIPVYHVRHLDLVRDLEVKLQAYPGLFVTGNSYRGMSISSCVDQGASAAIKIEAYLKQTAASGIPRAEMLAEIP